MSSESHQSNGNGEDPAASKSPEIVEKKRDDEGNSPPSSSWGGRREPVVEGKSVASMTKRERKRDREKQRRSDLNYAFDSLMELIFRINPRRREEAEANRKGGGQYCKGKSEESPLLSRLDIVNEAVETMGRIHLENEERKGVILHLSRGLLASRTDVPPPLDPVAGLAPMQSSLAAARELERQELQRRIELQALLASREAAGLPQSFRNDQARALQAEAALLDLSSQRPMAARQLALGERNPMESSLALARAREQNAMTEGLGGLGGLGGLRAEGLMADAAIQRARLNQLIQEDQQFQAASMGLGAEGGLGRLVSRNKDNSVPLSGDSIRQAIMRERALAEAAAARSHGGMPGESSQYPPAAKRMRDSY